MDRQRRKGSARLSNSSSPSLNDILEVQLSRRSTLRGGLGLAASTVFAGAGISALAGCSDSNGGGNSIPAELKFASVRGSSQDNVTIVPEGFNFQILAPWGTPLLGSLPVFAGDGTNTAADQNQQVGQNHDGIHYFPINGSNSGLLVMNHEYTNSTLYAGDGRQEDENGRPTNADEVRKDIRAHGVSVIEVFRNGEQWAIDTSSAFNRRITVETEMEISGPARGHALLQTPFSAGTRTRGTVNNCGKGHTPWDTYLTCEENIQGYFVTSDANPPRATARMGINENGFGYFWNAVAGDPSETAGEFARFDVSTGGGWENEANNFGWIVEIDPMQPNSVPKKRTAMGRFRHEGCEPGRIRAGEPIAFYMGDDARFEYLYKFVTADAWDPNNPDPDMLDKGTLYVAKFSADGTGEWIALTLDNPTLAAEFSDMGELLVNTRTAGDLVGATPMDRPEWTAVDPNTGEMYVTLTNNSRRETASDDAGENAANPRTPNTHGHVLRLREDGDRAGATSFVWNNFVFGSPASADESFNRSGLTTDNEFGGPDGLWFDPRGVLWIQTDNGAPLDYGDDPNDQMLAVIPARLGSDSINAENQAQLKRFFVGPSGCEVTGVIMTPDFKTMFINVQHPGGSWPLNNGTSRPRSATVVIQKDDGGEIL